jgi:hypothetical protein
MRSVKIKAVDSIKDEHLAKLFLNLPKQVYYNDPNYCAPFSSAVLQNLRRQKFLSAQRIFFAYEDEVLVARVVARWSLADNKNTAPPLGMLGFFEALHRPQIVAELLKQAVQWLVQAGCNRIVGPIDGDTWHTYRLKIEPFGSPPFLMEPYNPNYYPQLWENSGFRILEKYYTKRIQDLAPVVGRLEPLYQRACSRGFIFQSFEPGFFKEEMKRLYGLTLKTFFGNFYYSEISYDDFYQLYKGIEPLLAKQLIWFAQAPDKTDIGFLFAFPDYVKAVTAMRGQKNILSNLHFWLHKKDAHYINFKTLGVVPAYRNTPVAAALAYLGYQHALDMGFPQVNICLVRQGR